MNVERFKAYLCRGAKWYFDCDYLDKLDDNQLAWLLAVMGEVYDGVPLHDSPTPERRESYNRKNRMRRDVYYIMNQKTPLEEYLETEESPRWKEENSLRVYDAVAGRKEKKPHKKRNAIRRESLEDFVESEENPHWREENSLMIFDALAGREEGKCKQKRKKRALSSNQQ